MELKNFYYILLLAGMLAIPTIGELRKPSGFLGNLKYLIPAILFSGAIYIIWDIRFEEQAIWRFNFDFLLGPTILNLPIEEWIYFLALPILGVYIYELLNNRFFSFEKPNLFLSISLVLFISLGIATYVSKTRLYPFFTFFLITIYLGYTIFRNRFKKHYTKFYLTYIVLLVPYVILYGILTSLPVIEYNPAHIIGTRIYSIPIENFASLFLLLLMNITIYEYLKERRLF